MIEISNISKTYRMGEVEVRALRNVSLSIGEGEFVAIMGASGSGKSTLLHVIGFLDKPDSGTYALYGHDITRLSDDELSMLRNRTAGFVFQHFYLLPRMTALENAMLPLVYAGKRRDEHSARSRIEAVGLAARSGHYPNEMSGGEQQRVAIARALVNEPLIIFADEPTGNLDTKNEEEVLAVLRRLNDDGKTVVMVTHENEVAAQAKRIIRMRDGEIVSDERRGKSRGSSPRNTAEGAPRKNIFATASAALDRAEFADYIRQAAGSILAHKLRSFLSVLGILIGVAAVISMLALGEGAKASVSESLSALGTNLLTVRPGSHRMRHVALETGSVTRLTVQDAHALSMISGVARTSPSVMGRAQLVYGNRNWNSQAQGVGTAYAAMKSMQPVAGRFFTEDELRNRSKVAVLGSTVARELFKGASPLGRTIKINRINFHVIGVLPVKGVSFFRDQDDVVLLPVTTAMFRLLGREFVDFIEVEVASADQIERAMGAIAGLIKRRHRIAAEDDEAFHIRDMSEMRAAMTGTIDTISILLGIVASISLFVGGIGIMNIMLVSVKERIKEIGLRKAIGARKRDIRTQFLIESAMMTFAGGVMGILIGSGLSLLLSLFAGWSIMISPFSIIASTLFSVLIGVFFGLWPALQAARLNPIEALRYE
ncbi:MAG TPA: ABC transporter permease [Spirochaetota bacterium]|nr:ABC transporter permease [Spirochaetota bacterium]HNT10825.1 ABC transporter permease [Spirochaetota bacterium]HOS40386.1 ABC transporter permease [Spirochaetota bacterium]